MTGLELRHWAIGWGFTHTDAAAALGIGRSSFCNYLKEIKVPENVRLATMGYDSEKRINIEHKYTLLKRRFGEVEKLISKINRENHNDQ